ncbi:hypothetical protein [Oceanobacillus profundus]
MSGISAKVQKIRKKGCGCGSSQVLKSRRLDGATNSRWAINRPIKARNLR